MRVGSLFSGVGGFDLGLERAGHTIVFQCEADEWRRRVLAERFPGVPCYPDVRDVGGGHLQPDRDGACSNAPRSERDVRGCAASGVDLLCGGFPCQDLSVAGRRAGLAGGRSGLFFEFARVADEFLRPGGWWLVENVPGLLSSNGGRDFAVVLATMADLGFHDVAWRVLDSRFFGVAQRRRRVFILARRARGCSAREVLLEPEGSGGDSQAGGEAEPGATFASLSGLGSGGPDDNDAQAGRIVTIAGTLTSGSHPASTRPGRRREDDTNLVTYAIGSHAGSNGEASNESHAAGGPVGMGIRVEETPALRAGRTQAVGGGMGVRRLTPKECERLQGFPDDWTLIKGAPDSRRYAAMGDAVTVPVIEWIGRRLDTYGGDHGYVSTMKTPTQKPDTDDPRPVTHCHPVTSRRSSSHRGDARGATPS